MAMNETAAALKRRWKSPAGERLRGEARARLLSGDTLEGLELHNFNGRVDLRGTVFPGETTNLQGVQLRNIDFSAAALSNFRFVDCVIEDCAFDQANCRDWRLWGTKVVDCSFGGADLRNSSLGAWRDGRGNTFTRVSFISAKLSDVGTTAAVYEDCDFSFADLRNVNFWQSSLIRCKFAGVVREVTFDGRMLGEGKPDANPMLDVDFTEAEFDGCDFRGVDFSSVRLPRDHDLVLIDNAELLERAVAGLPEARTDESAVLARMIFGHAKKLLGFGPVALLNLRDFPMAADLFRELLMDAGWISTD